MISKINALPNTAEQLASHSAYMVKSLIKQAAFEDTLNIPVTKQDQLKGVKWHRFKLQTFHNLLLQI